MHMVHSSRQDREAALVLYRCSLLHGAGVFLQLNPGFDCLLKWQECSTLNALRALH
jgi:hypothetical protein